MLVKFPYTVEAQDGKFLVQFIDWPTGFAEADTKEQVLVFATEVLEGLVEAYKEDGIEIPTASPVGDMPFTVVEI